MLGLAVIWSCLCVFLPVAAPYVVFVEVLTVGTLFVGALTITDRSTGAAAALDVAPVHLWERLAARLLPLVVLTVVGAVLVSLSLSVVLDVALAAVLLLSIAYGIAARRTGFVDFMVALSAPVALLFATALAVSLGLLTGWVWYAVPTTGVLMSLRGDAPYPSFVLLPYLALWAAAAVGFALRRPVSVGVSVRRRVRPLPVRPRWLVFPRTDVRNITRDTLLALVAVNPLLLALALRFGYPRLHLDLMPVLAILAVAVHVPVSYGMTGALIVLDDLEDGVLAVVRTSPLGAVRYLVYRLSAVTLLSAVGLAVAAPVSGVVPWSAAGALLLAVPLGPLMTLATLAVAQTRVQGATADKVLALPAYVPVAAWWLGGSAGWLLSPFPAFWIVRSWSGTNPWYLLGGFVCFGVWLIPLTYRTAGRLR
jgi:hypothetical protein